MKKCNVCQLVQPDSNNFCTRCGSSDFSPVVESDSAVPVMSEAPQAVPDMPQPMMPNAPQVPDQDMPQPMTSNAPQVPDQNVPQPMMSNAPQVPGQDVPQPMMPNMPQMPVQGMPQAGVMNPPKKKTGLFIGIGAAAVGVVALIVVLVLVFTVFLNPVNRFKNCMEKEDYIGAAEIYHESISGDADRYNEVYTEVYVQMQDLLQQYRDELISYDELMNKLYGIEFIGVLDWEIYDAFSEAEDLRQCREIYSYAENAYNDGEYAAAIDYYNQILGADFEHAAEVEENLELSKEAFREDMLAQAQEYIAAGQYDIAMSILQEALYVLPYDSELLAAQEECMTAEYDSTIQQFIEEARIYMGNNDYVGALGCLDGYLEVYPTEILLQEERNNCLTEFETYTAEESLRLAKAGEYQHAASLAASGLGYFSSTRVTELLTIYESYIPVILGEMEMFENNTDGGMWGSKTDYIDQYLEDNYGNTYSNSLTAGCGEITYLVNFRYQTFSGTVAFPKGLESDSARESATLTIYGDGEKIAEFIGVNEASVPNDFTLDISAYERVTLEWTCEGYNIWGDWGSFATIFDGLLIPIPIELPDSV